MSVAPPGSEPLGATAARGVAAGLLGTVAMTAFQRVVEMPLSGRSESDAPVALVQRLLPIARPRGRRRRRINYVAHFGVGAAWGGGHALIARGAGLRGQKAVAAAMAVLYTSDMVSNTAMGLYAPQDWSARDWAVDVIDKLVLAEATGVVFDRLRASA